MPRFYQHPRPFSTPAAMRGVTKRCRRRRRGRRARFRARSGPASRLPRFRAGPTFCVGRRRPRRAPVPAPAVVPGPEPSPPASLPIRGRARRTGRNAGRGARCAAAVRLVPSARRSAVRLRLRDRRAPFAAPPRAACLPAFRPPSTDFYTSPSARTGRSAALSCAPRAVASLGALHSAVRLPAGGSGGPLQHPLCSCRAAARSERPGRRSPTGLRAQASRARIAPDGALRRRLRLRCGARHRTLARRARIARRLRPRPEAPRRPPAPSSPNPRLRAGPGTPPKSHRILCEIHLINQ